MPRLPEAMLRRLVDVDGRRHVAVVATVDGECAGIARWIALADEPGAAEVAVTVTDRYQGRGIGRLLVDALQPAAVRADLTTLVCGVDPTNRPTLGLLRSLGVELAFRTAWSRAASACLAAADGASAARVWHPTGGLAGLGHPQGQLPGRPEDMRLPGGVIQAAPQLAVDAGDRVGDERVGPAGVVAVDGGDQADPGHPGQVRVGDIVAGPEASGQAVSRSRVGEDNNPLSDGRAAGALIVQGPRLELVDGPCRSGGRRGCGGTHLTKASQSVRPGRFGVGMKAALIRGGSATGKLHAMYAAGTVVGCTPTRHTADYES
jgi:GNAT superfamily N-acetyltransferase